MRRIIIGAVMLSIFLITITGCSSSHSSESDTIMQRAKARDEALGYYMIRYAIPASGNTPYQEWQFKQFASTYATYKAYIYITPKSKESWENYLTYTDILGAREQAANLFKQALALPISKQQVFVEDMGKYLFDDNMGSLFIDFMRNVFLKHYADTVAEYLVKKIPLYESEFKSTPNNNEISFLGYLSNKYDLSIK